MKSTSEARRAALKWEDVAKADAKSRRGQGTGRLDRTLNRVVSMLIGCDESPNDDPRACLDPDDLRTLYVNPGARRAVIALTKTWRLRKFLISRLNNVQNFLEHNTGEIHVLDQTGTMTRMECLWTCANVTVGIQMALHEHASAWLDFIPALEEIPGPYLVFSFGDRPILIYADIESEKITVMRTMSDSNHTNWRPEIDIRTYVKLMRKYFTYQCETPESVFDNGDPVRLHERLVVDPWWPVFPFTD